MNFEPEVLVIGPGAEKGYYEMGALGYLDEIGALSKVKKYAACSIGAMIALLKMVGYSFETAIEKLKLHNTFEVLGNLDLTTLMGGSLFSSKGIRSLLEKMVKSKLGYIPDLHQLYMATGVEFASIGTNLNRKKRDTVFSHQNFGDMSCIDAVIISESLPFILPKIEYKGDVYIDGAFSNPYPVDVYNTGENKILGIYVDDMVYRNKINNNIDYFNCVLQSQIDTLRDLKIEAVRNNPNCYHLEISTHPKVKSHINPDLEDKEIMIKHGRDVCSDFMKLIKQKQKYKIKFNSEEEIPFLLENKE